MSHESSTGSIQHTCTDEQTDAVIDESPPSSHRKFKRQSSQPPPAPNGRTRGYGMVLVEKVVVRMGVVGDYIGTVDTSGFYPTSKLLMEVSKMVETPTDASIVLVDDIGQVMTRDASVSSMTMFVILKRSGHTSNGTYLV